MRREAITSKNWSISSDDLKKVDLVLLSLIGAMVVFGLLMVYSSSYIFAQERTGDGFAFIKKQLIFTVLGFIALLISVQIPYRKWAQWTYPIAIGALALLILVLIPGVGARVGGAQRWLRLGPLNVQPAEIAKFAMILFAARQLEKKRERIQEFVPGIVAPFLLPMLAMGLLLLQPDFGSVVMIAGVIFLLAFLAGASKKYLASILALGGTAASFLVLSTPYRRARVMTFLDPWQDPMGKGFQVLQSMLGLHNGSFFGVGLGNGKEKLFYLPEAHNDFIFAVIGEELGFIGVACVVAAFCILIYRGLRIAELCLKQRNDYFGAYLATGITLALGLQAFVNMGVVFGLLPTKGLTLPFISYGGSALLIDLFAVGVLLSISKGQSYDVIRVEKPEIITATR